MTLTRHQQQLLVADYNRNISLPTLAKRYNESYHTIITIVRKGIKGITIPNGDLIPFHNLSKL